VAHSAVRALGNLEPSQPGHPSQNPVVAGSHYSKFVLLVRLGFAPNHHGPEGLFPKVSPSRTVVSCDRQQIDSEHLKSIRGLTMTNKSPNAAESKNVPKVFRGCIVRQHAYRESVGRALVFVITSGLVYAQKCGQVFQRGSWQRLWVITLRRHR
jgi:hypothetical protein